MKLGIFTIRRMTRIELNLAIQWASAEGWNPGTHDADCFYAADPNGFFVGEFDENPVGCISAIAYDHTFGFLGFYIVKPEFRNRGYGTQLWEEALKYMGDRNVGADAVLSQLENYKRWGFETHYHSIRFEGVGVQAKARNLVKLSQVEFDELAAYDRGLFPAKRMQFLKRWIQQPESVSLCVVKARRIAGYGVLRACYRGFKIGPLFADDEWAAEDLFTGLSAPVAGAPVFLDVPQPNAEALALAKRHNMKPVFETARIYNKGPIELPLNRIYGVTSFELG